jgi:low affinity Fe/Cu permease
MSGGAPHAPQASAFDRFAEAASKFVSNGAFFAICLIVVIVWMPTIVIFQSIDTWQLVINTMTSVLAFLLIALLQNSERRYDDALHRKIDTIASTLADLIERGEDGDAGDLRRDAENLREAVGAERKL